MIKHIYSLFLIFFLPFIVIIFFLRFTRGKEVRKRYLEKFGLRFKDRPLKKEIIWFNACSVGEVKSILGLTKIYSRKGYAVLITSNTLLSGIYIKENFPKSVIHQFTPFDFKFTVNRFINYWRPKLGIFVESEIWPNLIYSAKEKKVPLYLVQARFSEKTLKGWKYFSRFFKSMLNSFDLIIAKSEIEKNKILDYTGVDVNAVADLKLNSTKLKTDEKELLNIKRKIVGYTVVTALSTHPGEEKILIDNFQRLKTKESKIILMLQPRHPARSKEIIDLIKSYNLSFKTKSLMEYPDSTTDIYIFDTFGESGNLISASDIIIIGGTLVPVGGHNIIEPAQFGKCLISGEYFFKINDIMDLFINNNAAFATNNMNLLNTIESILKNRNLLEKMGINAYNLTKTFKNTDKLVYKKICLQNENTKILV